MEENSCCCGKRGEKEFICPTTVNLRQSTRDDADEKVIKGTNEEGTEAVGKPKNRVIAILVASVASISTLCHQAFTLSLRNLSLRSAHANCVLKSY